MVGELDNGLVHQLRVLSCNTHVIEIVDNLVKTLLVNRTEQQKKETRKLYAAVFRKYIINCIYCCGDLGRDQNNKH